MSYTEVEIKIIEYSSIICSTISFISCMFIGMSWVCFPHLRTFAYSLVMCAGMSSLVRSFSKMWGSLNTGTVACEIQGCLTTFGGIAQFAWISIIAIVMFTLTFYTDLWLVTHEIKWKRLYKWIIIIFSIALISGLIPVFTKSYGNVGGWCWIVNTTTIDNILRWILFYIWNVISVCLCVYIYVRLHFYFKKVTQPEMEDSISDSKTDIKDDYDNENNNDNSRSFNKLYTKIKYYPLALIIGYTIPTFNRIINIFMDVPFGLQLIQAITTGLFGFILCIIYGISPAVIHEYKKALYKRRGISDINDDRQNIDSTTETVALERTTNDMDETR